VQISPRYDGSPLVRLEDAGDPTTAVLRQRQRLGDVLTTLDEAQWSAPSRCEGWSVRDVVAHLAGTNRFWALSISAGLAGEPTRLLAAFDPVATPAQLVEAQRSLTPAEVLDKYETGVAAIAEVLAAVEGEGWEIVAEAPPGHVSVRAVAAHALWDAWVHERDILLPLGLDPVEEPDEVALSLRYAAALGPAFTAAKGTGRRGVLAVEATDPDLRFTVEVGDEVVVRDGSAGPDAPCLRGPAVDLLEGLSFRAPLDHDLGPDHGWLVAGLDEVFDLSG
jgi:uncharacterized protein (TIGR03083 family)